MFQGLLASVGALRVSRHANLTYRFVVFLGDADSIVLNLDRIKPVIFETNFYSLALDKEAARDLR